MGVNHPKDKPWLFRTYAGHTSAAASNELFHRNLAAGQTGLSVAFDLPTQCGYDSDHPMAAGEVGKVGVPVTGMGDMRSLLDGIPLDKMNTSMTINATAMWLFSLYVSLADEQNAPRTALTGTTQNDILKEYLSRGTHIYPPGPSMRLITDMVTFCAREVPRWNPMNVCSYHLQEAGATPEQEVAYTLANAIAVLDAVRATGAVAEDDFGSVVGRISFFCNAGIRFIEEACKMRAFTSLWDRIALERYGVSEEKYRRFRYGVQVNSLGLTALQPENNVYRILLEALSVTIGKDSRARAVQLPAWNEALGLPRPFDQQWSLRIQQILAHETDLLEYEDIFAGSHVIEAKTAEVEEASWAELQVVLGKGGSLEAIGYMKEQLVSSLASRRRAIEAGDINVVGVNSYTTSAPSPFDAEGQIEASDPDAEQRQIDAVKAFRASRDERAAVATLDALRSAAGDESVNLVPLAIDCARAGVTTGEWADVLRDVFGEFRAPTGVSDAAMVAPNAASDGLLAARARVSAVASAIGAKALRMLVGKPGLDGHSNGAEQIAVRARDAGYEVIYSGIRLTPGAIVQAALDEDVHVVGLSILSGGHASLIPQVVDGLRTAGANDVPVIAGGIIPEADAKILTEAGVARVYTPRDFDLTAIVSDIAGLVADARGVTI